MLFRSDLHFMNSQFIPFTGMVFQAENANGQLYSAGAEFEAAYQPKSADRNSWFFNHTIFKVNYAFIRFEESADAVGISHLLEASPDHQLNVSMNWRRSRYSVNFVWHYQDIYGSIIDDTYLGTIPAMNRLDVRLGAFLINEPGDRYGLEAYVIGRNLLGETMDGPSGGFEQAAIPTQYIVGLSGKYVF